MNKDNSLSHESAVQHVTGEAVYVGDMEVGKDMLLARVVYSPHASARIIDFDLTEARKVGGVHAVLSHKDIPGINQLNPHTDDEPCLASEKVICIGQAVFLIAAKTEEAAREAERKIIVNYEPLEPILSIAEAKKKNSRLVPPIVFEMGNLKDGMKAAKHVLSGSLKTGAQEHWYLETQAAVCVPGEKREMVVHASSQNPTETQFVVANVLGLSANEVVCEVKRMGGGFGGKETQANHVAAWAALLADYTCKPVKIVLFRDDDQKITGKRHRFESDYTIAFDDDGRILAYDVDLNTDVGCATDLSIPIIERAMFHATNAYFIPNIKITGNTWKTNLPSNTAFRGFGGPQGMAVIENAIDRVARFLNKDPLEVRALNFYQENTRNITPYGQKVEQIRLPVILERVIKISNYHQRRKDIDAFNVQNRRVKRGLALTPVKFGISFTATFLNQAGALVLVYKDGTMLVNHGGTEMGQGLNTKIRQVAALEMGIPIEAVNVNATNTSKVPNTSPTAASSGSDLNGMAVKNAVEKIKKRLLPIALKLISSKYGNFEVNELVFENGKVFPKGEQEKSIEFATLVGEAYMQQVSLSAMGFYRTPDIFFDKTTRKGTPFYYFAYGMAATEVEVDLDTGNTRVLRADIVHDVGESLNPAIDLGQVYGAYVQGLGWCITETVKWDGKGNLMNHSPDTYKIPTIDDIPLEFNVELLEDAPNMMNTIRRSKAVGEPPFMLAFSAWLAIKDAISAAANHQIEPYFELPANNELVVLAVKELMKNK
jgi:xanthine dehydrogenase molybdopterin binding subunit